MTSAPYDSDPLMDALLFAAIPEGSRVLVAVSGGPDSVALANSLWRVVGRGLRDWDLRLAHVNHQLRAEESDRDEAFVRHLAQSWELPIDVVRVDTREYAFTRRLSIEAGARELRYRALDNMLARWPGDIIVMGHTQNDQAETVVLRLLRGAGLLGLASMRMQRGHILRPFLDVSRETILDVLQRRRLGYRLDASNLDTKHSRNRVRRDVIPLLEALQPRARESLARTASLLQKDADFVLAEARLAASFAVQLRAADTVYASTSVLRSLHPALRAHALRILLANVAGTALDLDEQHIRVLDDKIVREVSGNPASLPHGITAALEQNSLALQHKSEIGPESGIDVRLSVPGTVRLPQGSLSAEVNTISSRGELFRLMAVCGPLHALCDASNLGPKLYVRSRRPGDRIIPLGMTGSRKLQDVLVDAHVPRKIRNEIPLVENDQHVVWIPGIILDNRTAVQDTTAQVVHLIYRRDA